MSQGLFRQHPIRCPRPNTKTGTNCGTRADCNRSSGRSAADLAPPHLPSSPECREYQPATPAAQSVGPVKDHKRSAGEGNSVLRSGLHPRGRYGPRRRLEIDLAPPSSPNLAAARRREGQETERQPRPDPCPGAIHLDQRLPQVLGRQEPMVLPLLPASRQHCRESARRVVRPITGRHAPRHDACDPLPQPLPGRPLTPRQRQQDPHQVGSLNLVYRQSQRLGNAWRSSSRLTCRAWSAPQFGV